MLFPALLVMLLPLVLAMPRRAPLPALVLMHVRDLDDAHRATPLFLLLIGRALPRVGRAARREERGIATPLATRTVRPRADRDGRSGDRGVAAARNAGVNHRGRHRK